MNITRSLTAIILLILCVSASAQAQGSTDGTTPLGLTPGSPNGSYPLSDFDVVNLYNGTLNFHLPIFQIAGRGGAAYPITLKVEKKWTVQRHFEPGVGYFYYADGAWWSETNAAWFLDVGRVDIRTGWREQPTGVGVEGLTRVTFTAPDGTEYEFRDQWTNGQPKAPVSGGFNRGTIFVTADGTAATFISASEIHETAFGVEPPLPNGYIKLKDGTQFQVNGGVLSWMRDRNGNKASFSYDPFRRLTSVTDSLNRVVTITYPSTTTGFTQISFKGYGGASRTIKVGQTNLANALRSGYTMQTASQLFPEMSAVWSLDAKVINYIELPDGRSYQLRYNPYGELARVVLPTGGAVEYEYAAGLTDGAASGVFSYSFPPTEKYVYRRVIERRIYPDGGSGSAYESVMTYSRPETTTTNLGYVVMEQRNASGTLLTKSQHYFYGSPRASFLLRPTHYPAWKDGREYKTEIFHTDGSTVLRRIENTFDQRASVSWWGGTSDTAPPNDPRTIETVTTLEPATANLVSKQTFGFDDSVPFNNQNNVKEYNFGSGSAGSLARETRTTFVTSSSYTDDAVHLRDLPSQVSVYDSSGAERARTTYEYDNYSTVSNHAALIPRSNVSGFDPSFDINYTTRGNATAITKHVFVAGSITGSISTYSQYDVAGNVLKEINGRGYVTEMVYTDCFGSPNGEAQTPTYPTELGSVTKTFAYVTQVKNAKNQSVFAQFDYYLGRVVDAQDANGTVSSGYYDDPLDRATQIKRAVGTTAENHTVFSYDDTANRTITTTSDLRTNNDGVLVSQLVYDQMGRTIETRQYEGGSNFISRQTQYDALGRPYKTSNPFRPLQQQSADWTVQAFDALGRVTSVTTPDTAVVSTAYSGNTVTVTDQAGKTRKSVTDALGRLIEVYEDPNGAAYQTSYTYDTLDNLVKVTQGSQQRFFMYDSLRRLLRARIPEQGTYSSLDLSDPLTGNSAWSGGYQYDANSNVTQKTDARGVVSTYVYDELDRNTTIDYSDTTSINPDVKRFYDGATNGTGRFWYSYAGGDYTTGSDVDQTAIDSYDALGRPLVQRQLFKLNNTWSDTYQTSRTYNAAGNVATLTYPSLHSVTYNYDDAGRLADKDATNLAFTGNLGDGVQRTYASGNLYSVWGSLSIERFGTQTQLYHKRQYNIRGQLWDVRVATGPDVNGSWNRGALQFFYENTYTHGASGPGNNGNVLKTNHYVPLDESSNTWAIHDEFYTYDALNRLSSFSEYFLSSTQSVSQQSMQSYNYDRWGNRSINPASWGAGINTKPFTIDTTTNRLGVPSGQSGVMTYDNAGNLTTDTYSGSGARTYDAENRMTWAGDYTGQTSRYTYDADGKRTRRQAAGSQQQWYIYGFEGELLAEYRSSTPASAPEKEYGYRNGQLLVTASGHFNVALASNGAVATASSAHTCCGFSTAGAINGNNRGPWGNGEGWNDATENVVPDWIQVDFAGSKTIDEINVFSLHDNYSQENTPTLTQTFSLYGLLAFDVQYWNGSSWVTVPGGSVSGNNKVWRKFTFSPVTTSKIRVVINAVPDAWSRVVEIQAFGTSAGGEKVQWLVPDHLGTPRIIVDETGSLAGVKLHDYLPFGEELFAGSGGRTSALGYTGDGVRQQFTGYERDIESGLDFAEARYYSNTQGRFTSIDPLAASATPVNPQTFNRYSYVTNSPLTQIDPSGTFGISPGGSQLGGIGSLQSFSLTATGSGQLGAIGSFESLAFNQGQPLNNPTSLGSRVIGVCSLLVEFNGPGFMIRNGPGESVEDGVYGLGFTVSGWVDGTIGKVERTVPGTRIPETDVVDANGKWTIQQWGAYSFRLTGDKDPNRLFADGEATKPDGPRARYRKIEGSLFVYSDFPGPQKQNERYGNLTYAEVEHDFAVKIIDGQRQCEVKFHVSTEFRNSRVASKWGWRP